MSQETILTQIIQQRRLRVAELNTLYPAAKLAQMAMQSDRPRRSLYAALGQPDKGFILECKKASPSKGLIREQFDPVDIAKTYQPYAAAISVLTEPDYFQGDFAYLQAVSRQVQIPVLCKDFIIEPVQVYLARYFGADAILLMLSVLDDNSYKNLARLAHELGLEVLTEVSSEAEMRRAAAIDKELPVRIIGINHRNLNDLSIDPQRSQSLAALAPPQARLVAESGFTTHQQVHATAPYVDGFLVGSHLTAQADIDRACRRLIYGEHKVCGLTRASDALAAASCGAVYGGLIFAPRSPRQVTLEQARQIISQVRQLDYVAVVTDHTAEAIIELASALPLRAIQFHDGQSEQCIRTVAHHLPDVELWYAVDMSHPQYQATADTVSGWPVQRLVLDRGAGGSGMPFDWSRLDTLSERQRRAALLAGGLGPSNAVRAASLGIAGLDFNSAVESSPGHKDTARLARTFSILSQYYRAAPEIQAKTRANSTEPESKGNHHESL